MTEPEQGPVRGVPPTIAEGRYRVEELLGSGGMGLVVRAHDTQLDRPVAIKLLGDTLALDDDARQRFEREAQAAARLTHPHVVQVFDVGETAERPYVVMELLAGGSLADELHATGRLDAAGARDVMRQTLQGLAAAHDVGLLHRDLKPANLLRDRDGTVKVTDFGAAQIADAPKLTRTGVVLGTLSYLAPERLTGAPASARTELYALGATALELLTGTAPTRSQTSDQGPSLPELPVDTPAPLAAMVTRCLAEDPARRPVDVEAALAILDLDDDEATALLEDVAEGDPDAPSDADPAHAPTVAVPAGRDPTRTLVLDGAAEEPGAAEGRAAPRSQGGRGTGSSATWRWGAALVAALAVIVVLVLAGGDGGDGGGAVPPGDTPAETLTDLADWIEQRSAGG